MNSEDENNVIIKERRDQNSVQACKCPDTNAQPREWMSDPGLLLGKQMLPDGLGWCSSLSELPLQVCLCALEST